MLNVVAEDNFFNALDAKLDEILDPNIIQFVDKKEMARQVAEGDKINLERGGHNASDVNVVTLNGVTTYF